MIDDIAQSRVSLGVHFPSDNDASYIIGNEILKKGNLENYNKSGKIYVNNLGKVLHTVLSIGDLIKLYFVKEDKKLTIKEHEIIMQDIEYNERF